MRESLTGYLAHKRTAPTVSQMPLFEDPVPQVGLTPDRIGVVTERDNRKPRKLASSSGWNAEELHRRFIKDLGGAVISCPPDFDLGRKPVEVQARVPLPPDIRAYLYTLTTHAQERKDGTYRAQLILPGQVRGMRARLDFSGAFVVLGAYEPVLDLYVMWDALRYDEDDGVAYSRNVQVDDSKLHEAIVQGLSVQTRTVRSRLYPRERIIACRSDRLADAIALRFEFHIERQMEGG